MADTNRSRNAELNGLAEDDPLSELARIIGHESAAKQPAQPVKDQADLEIDLEGELLGELSSWNENEDAGATAKDVAAAEPVEETAETTADETTVDEGADDPLAGLDLETELEAAFDEDRAAGPALKREAEAFPAWGPEMDEPLPGAEASTAEEPATDDDAALEPADDTDMRREGLLEARENVPDAVAELPEEAPESHAGMTGDTPADVRAPVAELRPEEGPEAPREEAGEGPAANEDTAQAVAADEAADEAGEHFPPLYADEQPAMEPEEPEPVTTEDGEASEDLPEPFDYARAAGDRHEFLLEMLEEDAEAPAKAAEADSSAEQPPQALSMPEETGQQAGPEIHAAAPAAQEDWAGRDDAAEVRGEAGEGDPFGVLAGNGTRSLRTPTTAVPAAPAFEASYGETAAALQADGGEAETSADGGAGQPEIETVDIFETVAALPDDLDIPEVKEEPEVLPASELDDFEAELAGAFGSLVSETEADEGMDEEHAENAPLAAAAATTPPAAAAATTHLAADYSYRAADDLRDSPSQPAREPATGMVAGYGQAGESGIDEEYAGAVGPESADFYFDPTVGEEMAPAEEAEVTGSSRRRGFLVAALVGGIAVVGGLGAFALSSDDDGAAVPALVKADEGPIKVKPENPGGPKIPNQDSEVYERVAGNNAKAPAQERLVTSAEEPVDLTPPAEPLSGAADSTAQETADAAGKSEERLAPPPEESGSEMGSEVVALQPRRVKTVIVKPDGTIVQSEEAPSNEQTATGAEEGSDVASGAASDDPAVDEAESGTGSLALGEGTALAATEPPATDTAGALPAADGPAAVEQDAGTAVGTALEKAPIPAARPEAPPRGTDNAPQVASRQPAEQAARNAVSAPAAESSSEWSVQIASQPTVKGAQQSYQNLAQRYGDLLSGRGVNIVRAEIDGKGTYYRVRIPSSSKEDAIDLCSKLKSAGGSCFVSK